MRDKIIEILKKHTETAELINSGVYADAIEDGKFENIAQEVVKLFAIHNVSQQRELLIAYHKHNTIIRNEKLGKFIENHVDEYLSNL